MVSVPRTQLYPYNIQTHGHGWVPIKLIYKKQAAARFGWWAGLLIPDPECQLSCQKSMGKLVAQSESKSRFSDF